MDADVGSGTAARADHERTPYYRLDACSVTFTSQHVLEFWEPNCLSVPNIRRMLTRGKSNVNKDALGCIVEFGSGQSADLHLSGSLCVLASFKDFMLDQYNMRGRRCHDLPLPPHWPRDGLYEKIGLVPSGLKLRHRFVVAEVVAPLKALPPQESAQGLFMNWNWSETRASISSVLDKENRHSVLLAPYFPTATA